MKDSPLALDWASDTRPQTKTLLKCALVAFIFEATLLTAVGWHEHWLAHPQKTTGQDDSRFIDAQVYQVPAEAHLVEEKKAAVIPQKPEAVLSRDPNRGQTQDKGVSLDQENQTQTGPKMAASHGPVPIYTPLPIIPVYLQNREFKTSVVIDFYVNSQGTATPRLVGGSGNEELDAIALAAAKKWQFRAAEEDHKPIDSKTRLRMNFEVQ